MRLGANVERFSFSLDRQSGVPVYRQLIDQVQAATAAGALEVGGQLPTVRQVAVDLEINPNTVMRAYREMEIRGMVDTQQGTGTFVARREVQADSDARARQLAALAGDAASRAGAAGFRLRELIAVLEAMDRSGTG